jgi:plastocyanin
MRLRARTIGATIATIAAVSAMATVALSAQGAASVSRSHTVVLENIRFNPGTVSVKRGESVTWVWRDGPTRHNVTGSGFKSRTMANGSFTVRFTHKGTFNYHCSIHWHQGMVGKIVVH